MPQLKVYRDDADFVIAGSMSHASEIWQAHVGEPHKGEWRLVPDDEPITIEVGLVLSGREFAQQKMTKTAAEWAAAYGPGFLCSTEY
jgi:hypothetical protein